MLREGTGVKRVILRAGKTDLRRGIDGLKSIIQLAYGMDPMEEGTLFLFCGTRSDRIKGLVWEGDGYLLLYKRIADGRFRWPRNSTEAAQITQEQYLRLLEGLEVIETPAIRKDVKYREVL